MARGAIVHEFDCPHRTPGENVPRLDFEWIEFTDRSVEFFVANGTRHSRNAFRANPSWVHDPENCDFFAAPGTSGKKLIVHKATLVYGFHVRGRRRAKWT